MCAIAGIYGIKKEGLLDQLSRDMAHRGPDGEGIYTNEVVALLNRRLAIIDRSGGDQPIYNEDKSLVVVYNGEIYNYIELRDKLKKSGHTFKTKSDTEVIIHGYEEWGTDIFDKLNGMFAIALYDIKENKLLLVRDHFGIKPLYYAEGEQNGKPFLLFASEITPILNTGLIKTEVQERILYRYLRFRIHDDGEETFFKGVKRLLPGEMMIRHANNSTRTHYSKLEQKLASEHKRKENDAKDSEVIDKFNQLLHDAVKSRLVSEVPVGSALSGGIDSSVIVAIVNQYMSKDQARSVGSNQNTFSAVFPGCTNDEEVYMDKIIKHLKQIKSHKVFPKSSEFFEDLPEFIRTQEEPTISSDPYAQFQIMKYAKNYVTVLLDGQGADEMLAGYLPYYFVYFKQLQNERKFGRLIHEIWSARDIFIKFAILKAQQILSSSHQLKIENMLKDSFFQKFSNEQFEINKSNLKDRLLEDIFKNSLPALLRYEDRNTMHFSLEGRVPFLDKKLVEFVFTHPETFIIRNGWNKYLLRQSSKHILPDKIRLRRNKIGFTTPEYEWFQKHKEQIYKIFLSESFANRPYWDAQKVLKAFRLFLQGKNDDTMGFWRLLNTEVWLREFIDSEAEMINSEDTDQKRWKLGDPNAGKTIDIGLENNIYSRIPVRTARFDKGDDYAEKIAQHIVQSLGKLDEKYIQLMKEKKWYVISSEKIVAISQGRSFFIWDISPSIWANVLSSFVSRTPYGIGLGSPWTMQIAIDEVGLPRILLAAVASVVTKPFGIKGVFYRVAGPQAAAIDGPTEYSLFPSNVSAKLAPKNPLQAAEKITKAIKSGIKNHTLSSKKSTIYEPLLTTFGGAVIIDANDIGRNVMGNATDETDSFFAQVMKDNPMGQGSEQTPLVLLIQS